MGSRYERCRVSVREIRCREEGENVQTGRPHGKTMQLAFQCAKFQMLKIFSKNNF